MTDRVITRCVICGKGCNHTNTHETCGRSSCRATWYRHEKEKKEIRFAIEKNDFTEVGYLKLSSIISLGFTVKSDNQIIVISNPSNTLGV